MTFSSSSSRRLWRSRAARELLVPVLVCPEALELGDPGIDVQAVDRDPAGCPPPPPGPGVSTRGRGWRCAAPLRQGARAVVDPMGNEQHHGIGVEPGTGGTPTPQLHVGQMRSRHPGPHGPLLERPGLLEHERQVGQGTSQVECQVHPVGLDGIDHQRHRRVEVVSVSEKSITDGTNVHGTPPASMASARLPRWPPPPREAHQAACLVEARHLPDVEHRGNASPAARSPHPPPGESHETVADHHVGPKGLDDRGHRVLGHWGGEVLMSSDGALPRLAAGLSFEPPKQGAERGSREPDRRVGEMTVRPPARPAGRPSSASSVTSWATALQHAGQLSLAPA